MNDRAYPYRKSFSLITKISQLEAGKLYIVEDYHYCHDEPERSLIRVLSVGFQGRCNIADYEYVNPRNLSQNRPHTNPGSYALWNFYIKRHAQDKHGHMLIWEAYEPIDVCPHCQSAEFSMIEAQHKISYHYAGELRYQLIGESSSYNRCKGCDKVYRSKRASYASFSDKAGKRGTLPKKYWEGWSWSGSFRWGDVVD